MRKFLSLVFALLIAVPSFASGSVSDIDHEYWMAYTRQMHCMRKAMLKLCLTENKTPKQERILSKMDKIFEYKKNQWDKYLESVAEDGKYAEIPEYNHCRFKKLIRRLDKCEGADKCRHNDSQCVKDKETCDSSKKCAYQRHRARLERVLCPECRAKLEECFKCIKQCPKCSEARRKYIEYRKSCYDAACSEEKLCKEETSECTRNCDKQRVQEEVRSRVNCCSEE